MIKVLTAAGVLAAALSMLFVLAADSGTPASATTPQLCDGQPLTHPAFAFFGFGSSADDSLAGIIGFGTQVINGLQGQDCIDGEDGNDLLLGGTDDDRLFGGVGADVLVGGQGNDQLDGGPGADLLIGAPTGSAASDIDVNVNPDGLDFCVNVDFPFGTNGPYIVNYTGQC